VTEWCQGRVDRQKGDAPFDDAGEPEGVRDDLDRACRGGAFISQPGDITAVYRTMLPPWFRSNGVGFRPVRTVPGGDL
jgi:formylglycine-generating enzyme required for sulfatase activity